MGYMRYKFATRARQVLSLLKCLREAAKKKRFFLGNLSQICLPTHPPQGFCKIWENERWNLGRKRRFSGWFGGVLRGLNLVWESATPPTHIWERYPKKTGFLYLPSKRGENYANFVIFEQRSASILVTIIVLVNDTLEPRAHTWNEGVVSEEEGGTSIKLVHHLAPPSLIIRSMIVRRTRRRWRIPCNTLGCTLKSSGSRVMKAGESRLSFPPQTWFFAMLPVFPPPALIPRAPILFPSPGICHHTFLHGIHLVGILHMWGAVRSPSPHLFYPGCRSWPWPNSAYLQITF